MKYKKAALWMSVCVSFVLNVAWAGDNCIPENAPTAATLWDAVNSPEVDACIRSRTKEEMKRLEFDDQTVDAALRKAKSIRAWYSLLGQLDAQRIDHTGDLGVLVEKIYTRADDAWKSVANTVYGEAAAPQAYQSAWTIDFDGQLPVLLNESGQSVLAPPN